MVIFKFPFRGETRSITPDERARLSGEFIELVDGVTHYELGGPMDGPVVVMVHGFAVPMFILDSTYQALTQAGFRVLRYDLFGRGFSDRPFVDYDLEFFLRQLADLLDRLKIDQAVNLLGLSMGGMVSAAFADQYPGRVAKLVLIDPAGFPLRFSPLIKLLMLPGVGEILFSLVGEGNLENGILSSMYHPDHIREFKQRLKPQMKFKGYKRALLSTVRAGFIDCGIETYKRVGRSGLPVLLIWGEEDTTVPFKHSRTLMELIPQIEFHPIPGAGHIPHYEKAETVNPILIDFLER
jgi:pimeloyl-ACP methyl ester carboxylesterase